MCEQCFLAARTAVDRFNQYTYLNYYDANPNITNSDQLSGIQTCRWDNGNTNWCMTDFPVNLIKHIFWSVQNTRISLLVQFLFCFCQLLAPHFEVSNNLHNQVTNYDNESITPSPMSTSNYWRTHFCSFALSTLFDPCSCEGITENCHFYKFYFSTPFQILIETHTNLYNA